jgi:hypothetical protein
MTEPKLIRALSSEASSQPTIRERIEALEDFSEDTLVDDFEEPTEERYLLRAADPEAPTEDALDRSQLRAALVEHLSQADIETMIVRVRTISPRRDSSSAH